MKFVGFQLSVCVFGEEWQVSVVETYLPSRGVTESLAKYEIGLHIGLSSYNVTFKSKLLAKNNEIFGDEFFYKVSLKFCNTKPKKAIHFLKTIITHLL